MTILSNIRQDARQYILIDQIKRLNARMALQERETFDDLVSNTLRLGNPATEIFGIGDLVVEGDAALEGSLNVGVPTTPATTATGDAAIAGNLLVEGITTLQGLTVDSLEVGNPAATAGLGDIAIENDLIVEGTLGVTGISTLGVVNAGNMTADRLEIGAAAGTPGAGDLYIADELSVDGISNLGTVNAGAITGSSLNVGSGTISAGAITGSSLNLGSGALDAGDAEFTGDVTTDGGIYAGNRTANPPSGEIAASGDIIAGGGMAVGNVSAGPATGDILFYNGGTNVGQLGTDDTTWFRINQDIAKNIYTPRAIQIGSTFQAAGQIKTTGSDFIAEAGGIRVGPIAITPDAGDVVYNGDLGAGRGSTVYTVYGSYYYATAKTNTSWDGDDKADQTTTLTLTSWGIPDNVKAVLLQVSVQSSNVITPSDQYIAIGPTTNNWAFLARALVSGKWTSGSSWCPTSAGGDITVKIQGPTSGTFLVYLNIWGYTI